VWKVSKEKKAVSTLTGTRWEAGSLRMKPSNQCKAAFAFSPNDARGDF